MARLDRTRNLPWAHAKQTAPYHTGKLTLYALGLTRAVMSLTQRDELASAYEKIEMLKEIKDDDLG